MEIICKVSFSTCVFTVDSLLSCECIYVLIIYSVSFISFFIEKKFRNFYSTCIYEAAWCNVPEDLNIAVFICL
jgi:hypothetical protein